MISLAIGGVVARYLAPLLAGKLQSKLIHDLLRNFRLHRQQIRRLAIVLLPPQLGILFRVHQFGLDNQRIAALQHASGEHRSHSQLFAQLPGIQILVLVVENRAARHDAKIGKLRKIVDQSFGDAVAEIFRAGIAGSVDQGHHR